MSVEVNNESGVDVDETALAGAVAVRARRRCASTRSPSCRCCSSTPTRWRRCTCSGWTSRARPTCCRSRWTSCARARDDREPEPGLLGDVVLCPQVAARAGGRGRPLHRATSCTCCARTASCTCSATTTPSPTRRREMFDLQTRPAAVVAGHERRLGAGPMSVDVVADRRSPRSWSCSAGCSPAPRRRCRGCRGSSPRSFERAGPPRRGPAGRRSSPTRRATSTCSRCCGSPASCSRPCS